MLRTLFPFSLSRTLPPLEMIFECVDVLPHCNMFCSYEHGIQLALGIWKTTVNRTGSFLWMISSGLAVQTVTCAARTKENVGVPRQECTARWFLGRPGAGHRVQPSVDGKQARGLLPRSAPSSSENGSSPKSVMLGMATDGEPASAFLSLRSETGLTCSMDTTWQLSISTSFPLCSS